MKEKFRTALIQNRENSNLSFEETIKMRCSTHAMMMVQMPSLTSKNDSVCTAVEKELAAFYETGKLNFLHPCSASCLERGE